MKRGIAVIWMLVFCFGACCLHAQQPADSTVNRRNSVLVRRADTSRAAPFYYNYYDRLGAACKMEWQFEKTTKVPLRLRLGSLQQTDYMEQKPNALQPAR